MRLTLTRRFRELRLREHRQGELQGSRLMEMRRDGYSLCDHACTFCLGRLIQHEVWEANKRVRAFPLNEREHREQQTHSLSGTGRSKNSSHAFLRRPRYPPRIIVPPAVVGDPLRSYPEAVQWWSTRREGKIAERFVSQGDAPQMAQFEMLQARLRALGCHEPVQKLPRAPFQP